MVPAWWKEKRQVEENTRQKAAYYYIHNIHIFRFRSYLVTDIGRILDAKAVISLENKQIRRYA